MKRMDLSLRAWLAKTYFPGIFCYDVFSWNLLE